MARAARTTSSAILLLTIVAAVLAHLPSASAGRAAKGSCRSVGNLQFNSVAPRRVPALSFCHKYRERTCCNRTHGDTLLRRNLALQVAGVGDRCVDVSAKVSCSACHPDYGTGRMVSICPSLCDEWYNACGDEFFATTMVRSLSLTHTPTPQTPCSLSLSLSLGMDVVPLPPPLL